MFHKYYIIKSCFNCCYELVMWFKMIQFKCKSNLKFVFLITILLSSLVAFFLSIQFSLIGYLYHQLENPFSLKHPLIFDYNAMRMLDILRYQSNNSLPECNQTIPNHIHFTWKQTDLTTYPSDSSFLIWQRHSPSPNSTFDLWTDVRLDNFIKKYYPMYLTSYHSFAYDIQRADFARYLLLYHYGGYYVDMDAFPTGFAQLNEMNCFDLVLPLSTDGNTLSNHFLAAKPRSPFLLFLLNQIISFSFSTSISSTTIKQTTIPLLDKQSKTWSYLIANIYLPYFIVFFTTGPFALHYLFQSYFQHYYNIHMNSMGGLASIHKEHVLVLHPQVVDMYVHHYAGRSWHQFDGYIFNWFMDFSSFIIYFLPGFVIGCSLFCLFLYWKFLHQKRRIH